MSFFEHPLLEPNSLGEEAMSDNDILLAIRAMRKKSTKRDDIMDVLDGQGVERKATPTHHDDPSDPDTPIRTRNGYRLGTKAQKKLQMKRRKR